MSKSRALNYILSQLKTGSKYKRKHIDEMIKFVDANNEFYRLFPFQGKE